MTDDKAIEAAKDAIASELARVERDARADQLTDDELNAIARAAIAAADRARAEGFDFEYIEKSESGQFERRAFAAGLAKGEADRAALVEALRHSTNWMVFHRVRQEDFAEKSGEEGFNDPRLNQQIEDSRAALALVRKGE